ncbi:MAG: hypothetical protein U9P90_02020 [Patescibacteria group bacterium]|nr:hypothetical protein [Patescibacteria group bacterium]
MRVLITSLILTYLVVGLFPSPIHAFNPDFILSNEELGDYNSMSLYDIQIFLQRKNSRLAYYLADDIDGGMRTGAEVIYRAARAHRINPRVLLVTLQKEQSLVENPNPSQYNLDWATGYARCDDYDLCGPDMVPEHKGYAKQVDDAAGWYRWYLDGKGAWLKNPGTTYNIDGHSITPANLATAALYAYTPHYHGNYNFWTIFNRWFGQTYPEGSLLKLANDNTAWYLKDNKIRPITSMAVLFSRFNPNNVNILTVKPDILDGFEQGKEIKFENYSLLRSPQGNIFLTIDDERRGFTSWDAFVKMGFKSRDIIDTVWGDINNYKEGEPITTDSIFPIGKLLQNNQTGGVYFVENGIKKPILSRELLHHSFPDYKIHSTNPEEFEQYTTGEPVKFEDGTLVKNYDNPRVYVISDGYKRPIDSEKAFTEMGWKWENIIKTNTKTISIHITGDTIFETETSKIELANY